MTTPQTIEEIQAYINAERQKGATIIQPSDLTPISYYRPVLETVFLAKEDYYQAQGKFRIHFSGLTKLGNAAGVEWLPEDTCRTDNRSDKMYVSFRAVGGVRKNDGKLYPMKAEYDLDLEIIEEELRDSYIAKATEKKLTGNAFDEYVDKNTKRDFIQKRKRKLTLAESGAKSRVLRAILDIPSQYANESQLRGMPFIVVRFVLDHQNPDIRNLFLQTARDSMMGLYGRSPAVALPMRNCGDGEIIEISPTPVTHELYNDEDYEPLQTSNPPTPEESQEIDFRNSSIEEQVAILSELCLRTGYDLEAYLKKAGKELSQMKEETRVNLFQYLRKLNKNAKAA